MDGFDFDHNFGISVEERILQLKEEYNKLIKRANAASQWFEKKSSKVSQQKIDAGAEKFCENTRAMYKVELNLKRSGHHMTVKERTEGFA